MVSHPLKAFADSMWLCVQDLAIFEADIESDHKAQYYVELFTRHLNKEKAKASSCQVTCC